MINAKAMRPFAYIIWIDVGFIGHVVRLTIIMIYYVIHNGLFLEG